MGTLSNSDYKSRKKVSGLNNSGGLDLEQDVAEDLAGHGICIGIAGSWVIGILSGNDGAHDIAKFESYFKEFLRYQGAYIKFAHDISPGERIQSLMGSMGIGDIATKEEKTKQGSMMGVFPSDDTTWAAHISAHGHDIGCAHRAGGDYYIMDPNHGLYVYDGYAKMEATMEAFRAARKAKRGHERKTSSVWIYRPK